MPSAINITFGAIVGDFIANIGQAGAAVGVFTRRLNTDLAAGFAAADREQRIFDRGIGRSAANLQAFGKHASVVSAGLGLIGISAFNSYSEIDGLERSLKVTTGSAGQAAKELNEFVQIAKQPGLGLDEAVGAGVKLETLGYQAKTAQEYVSQLGNAIALGGKGKAEFDSVINQITQMSGKARVLGDDLKPILNASPVIAKAIQDMFGTSDSEKISGILQSAGRGPKDFIDDLVKKLAQLERVSGGPKNALENLGDSFTLAGYQAGKAADNAFNLTGKIDALGAFVSNTATKFGLLPAPIQAVTLGLVGTAAAIGPLSLGLGTLISLGPQFVSGFGAIRTALAALLSPIGVTAIAITAAVGAFLTLGLAVAHYDEHLETSADKAKIFAEVNGQVAASIAGESTKLNNLLGIARDETISKKARIQAVKDLNALSPQYLGNISLETINTVEATKAINQYATALRLKAKVQILSQQSAQAQIDLEKAQARSQESYVDRSRFSQDQIAINIKTVTSFSPQEDRDRLFDELGKARKTAEISRLQDAAKTIDAEYKKAFQEASKQKIEIDPPKIKPFDYSSFLTDSQSELQQAKDRLKQLREQIFAGNQKGIDTSALVAEASQTKAQIDAITDALRKPKAIRDTTEADLKAGGTLNIYKRYAQELKRQIELLGDSSPELEKKQEQFDAITRVIEKLQALTGKDRTGTDLGNLAPIGGATNNQVAAIIDNMTRIKALAPGLFATTGIQAFAGGLILARPTLEFYLNKIEEIKATIAGLTLNGLAVPPELLKQLADLKKAVKDAYAGASAADYGTNSGESGDQDAQYLARAQKRIEAMKAAGQEVKQTAEEMAASMKEAETLLKGQALNVIAAIGEGIGAGENPLKTVLKSLLGMLGDFLVQLGTKIVLAGSLIAGVEAVAPFLVPLLGTAKVNGPAAILAGGAMVLGGSLIKGFAGSFAGGGLIRGNSLIQVGENSRALAGGGEFVAPVALGADLISARILKTLQPTKLNAATLPSRGSYDNVQVFIPSIELNGDTIQIALNRAAKNRSKLG